MEGTEKHRAIDNGKQAFYDALRATILRSGTSMRRSSVVPRRHSPLFSAMIDTIFWRFICGVWVAVVDGVDKPDVLTSYMCKGAYPPSRFCAPYQGVHFIVSFFDIYTHFLISPLNSHHFHGSVSAAQVAPRHSDTELLARI